MDFVENRVTAYRPVLAIRADGHITWGNTYYDYDDIEESSYQCPHCHYQLDDVYVDEDLVKWLNNNNGNSQGSLSE